MIAAAEWLPTHYDVAFLASCICAYIHHTLQQKVTQVWGQNLWTLLEWQDVRGMLTGWAVQDQHMQAKKQLPHQADGKQQRSSLVPKSDVPNFQMSGASRPAERSDEADMAARAGDMRH